MIRPQTIPLRRLPQADEHHLRSTWADAKPRRIRRAPEAAPARDPGGWFVAGASTDVHFPRAGFQAARRLARLLRPAIRHTARRLSVDDLAYAERRYARRASEG